MSKALDGSELDLGLLLTEAAVAGIAKGGRYRIVSWYTDSPLLWGIHVPGDSAFARVAELRGARYAISRFGSGSHLMCYAHAKQRGWPVDELDFVLVGDLEGAKQAFEKHEADVFLWEKFMTQPLVESGRFKRLGEFAAPWPAFVVCASEPALDEARDEIANLLEGVLAAAAETARRPDTVAQIAERYGLDTADVQAWLKITRWSVRPGVDVATLAEVLAVLEELGLVAAGFRAEALLV